MTEVWIVLRVVDRDGADVVAVFATESAAETYAASVPIDPPDADCTVERHVVWHSVAVGRWS